MGERKFAKLYSMMKNGPFKKRDKSGAHNNNDDVQAAYRQRIEKEKHVERRQKRDELLNRHRNHCESVDASNNQNAALSTTNTVEGANKPGLHASQSVKETKSSANRRNLVEQLLALRREHERVEKKLTQGRPVFKVYHFDDKDYDLKKLPIPHHSTAFTFKANNYSSLKTALEPNTKSKPVRRNNTFNGTAARPNTRSALILADQVSFAKNYCSYRSIRKTSSNIRLFQVYLVSL